MDQRTAPVTPAQTPTSTHEHTCSMCHNIAQKCISVLPLHCTNVVCVCVCAGAHGSYALASLSTSLIMK